MASGGKRKGAGRPKGSKNKERTAIEVVIEEQRRQIEAGVEIAKEQIGETARRYAAVALEALAVTAVYGEGMARVQAARELLDRGYGKVPEPAAEPPPQIMEGIVIEPLRKSDGNGHDEPVRLEDWRNPK
jgi:hypothetical protein